MQKAQFLKGIWAQGQGNEVLLRANHVAFTEKKDQTKNKTQNHLTDSVEFRYSLGSQSNRNATGRQLPIPAISECQTEKNVRSPQGYVVFSPVSHGCDSWDL